MKMSGDEKMERGKEKEKLITSRWGVCAM